MLRWRSPVLASLNRLQLREFLLESTILSPAAGARVFEKDDYDASVYIVLSGSVAVMVDEADRSKDRKIRSGRIFGEMSLISGRRRGASVEAGADCVLMQVPRRTMLKLIASNDVVKRYVDRTFALRALQTNLAPGAKVRST